MRLNKKSIILIGVLAVFAIILVVFFFPDNQASYVVLTDAQRNSIDLAENEYASLRETLSIEEAREELVNKLNSDYEEIKDAHLGMDEYTIFVEFQNGRLLAIDTSEYIDYSNPFTIPENISESITYDKEQNQITQLSMESIVKTQFLRYQETPFISVSSSGTELIAQNLQDKMTAKSKKAIMFVPCGYQGVTAHYEIAELLKNHGWKDEDIVIKANMKPESMNIMPEDCFNLDDYGIILFFAHGNVDSMSDSKKIWLECCTLDDDAFQNNKLYQQWLDQKILVQQTTFGSYTAADPEKRYHSIGIRADFLSEHIGSLPDSYVHLATCHGSTMKDVFLTNGAEIVLSWFRAVKASIADANQENIARVMLNQDGSVYQGYRDEGTVRTYKDNFGGGKKWYDIDLKIYALPDSSTVAESYYFPAWFSEITITDIPTEASSIKVTLFDGEGNQVRWKQYSVYQNAIRIQDFSDVLFPATGTPSIKVEAFDGTGEELVTAQASASLSAGENSEEISLKTVEDRTHTDYMVEGTENGYHIKVDLALSSNKWEQGKEITATVTCTCEPVGDVAYMTVPGCTIRLVNANGEVLAYEPQFIGEEYGIVRDGFVNWGAGPGGPGGWGETATFTATFRLEEKSDYPYVEARCSWFNIEANFAKIYLR